MYTGVACCGGVGVAVGGLVAVILNVWWNTGEVEGLFSVERWSCHTGLQCTNVSMIDK